MKKLILAIAIAAIFAMGSMVYAGQFGPPEPAAKEGKVTMGVGYFYYSAEMKPKITVNFREVKAAQNQAYLQLGYGFAKNWEAYLRVGGADLRIKKAFPLNNADFKKGLKPFGTIGIKGVFNVTPSFGIGPFFQARLGSSYTNKGSVTLSGSRTIYGTILPAGTYTETLRYSNPREINFGLGLQGEIDDAILYGGPVVYWTRTKADGTIVGVTGPLTGSSISGSTNYKEKNHIGGFAGIKWTLGKGLNLEVEGQLKSRFSMGGALTYAF